MSIGTIPFKFVLVFTFRAFSFYRFVVFGGFNSKPTVHVVMGGNRLSMRIRCNAKDKALPKRYCHSFSGLFQNSCCPARIGCRN